MSVSYIFALFLPAFFICVDSSVDEASKSEYSGINYLIEGDERTATVKETNVNSSDNCVSDEIKETTKKKRRNCVFRFFHRVRKRIRRMFSRTVRSGEVESNGVKLTEKFLNGKHSQDLLEFNKDDIDDLLEIKGRFYSNCAIASTRDQKQLYVVKYLTNEHHMDEDLFKQIMENEIHMNRSLTKLNNNNFVPMMCFCRNDDLSATLVLEYVRGLNLEKLLYRYGKRLTLVSKYNIILKMTNALKTLHGFGIIHNDFKLSNVLLQVPDMEIKLIDFAFSSFAKSPKFNCAGSMMYAAPEVFREKTPACNMAKDIWALGCCMAQFITMEMAYDKLCSDSKIARAITFKVKNGLPVVPLNVSMLEDGNFRKLCERCCHMNPAKRPSAKKVSRDLQNLLAKEEEIQNVRLTQFHW